MKLIKTIIICLVLSSVLFVMSACSMDKCSEEMLDPSMSPSATNKPATDAPQATMTPAPTDNVPEGTDGVGDNARNRMPSPTSFIDDIFDSSAMPGMSPVA